MFIQLPMSLSSAYIWSWAELFGHSKTAELFRNQSSVLPVSALTCPPASVPPGAPHYLGLDSQWVRRGPHGAEHVGPCLDPY